MADRQNSDKETELTMCDVLEEEQELEEDANAVLGGSDDKNCSYDQGYVPRQALYACKSCTIDGFAGVCLACCYACHDGHEVVELYTKRNFRCDCGNSKFTNRDCVLNPNKENVNCDNKYNQNFKGLYCTCNRPYPDLDDSVPDQMIQCVMCEDWYHGRHLTSEIPDDYFEMVCAKCMDEHSFLFSYLQNPVIDVSADSSEPKESCVLKQLGESVKKFKPGFFPEKWRSDLCRCSECMSLYRTTNCEFLLNLDDTIQSYEERGKGEESQYDKGLSALGQLDRVKQMEAIRAYTSMKGELKEYLKDFADNKKTVRECDIKEFFERIGKKQKLNSGVPHFCR